MTFATVLIALGLLPMAAEDRRPELELQKSAQYQALAQAMTEAARDRRELAFLIAWGWHESAYSLRIHRNECRRWECDRGRARSPWQLHRNGLDQGSWDGLAGVENVRGQAQEAALRARRALAWCGTVEGAFRSMGGRGCSGLLPGVERRMATFRTVLARLQ